MGLETSTLLTVMAATGVAGAGVSAYGAYRQGQAQSAALDYNAQVAAQNAQATKEKAAYDVEQSQRRAKIIMGKQIAAYGKAGVDVGSGSPLEVLMMQAADAERDAYNIKYTADITSGRYLSQAGQLETQADNTMTAGYLNTGSSLLQGIGNLGTKYYAGKIKQPSSYPTSSTFSSESW